MELDIIGDVHGHAEALAALLARLGYAERAGAYRHPGGRRAVFLGDLIDRGPEQLRTIALVRAMREAGTAAIVMGNHEFNAIGLATPDSARPGAHLRERSAANLHQQEAFLGEAGGLDSPLHLSLVAEFAAMPLWIEFDGIGIVHACWSRGDMARLGPHLDAEHRFTEDGLRVALTAGTSANAAAEILLKGPEIALPPGVAYRDGHGAKRATTRTRWWDADARTLRRAAVERSIAEKLPEDPLPPEQRIPLVDTKPVLFGHYCMDGTPRLLSERLACLDFCVARRGLLCAYRFEGEAELDPARLVWVG